MMPLKQRRLFSGALARFLVPFGCCAYLLLGPGVSATDAYMLAYVALIRRVQAAGVRFFFLHFVRFPLCHSCIVQIQVYGYVHTTYGNRSISTVLDDVNNFYSWIGVNGIFVDEGTSSRLKFYLNHDISID